MTGFVTVPERLFAARCELASSADRAGEVMARIDAAARDVFGQTWTGEAAAAAGAGYAQWRDGADLVIAALADMAAAIESAGRCYAGAEQASILALERVVPAA